MTLRLILIAWPMLAFTIGFAGYELYDDHSLHSSPPWAKVWAYAIAGAVWATVIATGLVVALSALMWVFTGELGRLP